MKTTVKERFQKRMLRIEKKNILCRILAKPVFMAGMLFFRLTAYFRKNIKRFSMAVIALMTTAVYSSYSFPIFAAEEKQDASNAVMAEVEALEISEKEIYFDKVIILMDEGDMTGVGEKTTVNGNANKNGIPENGKTENTNGRTETDDTDTEQDYMDYVFRADDWRLILVNKQHSIPDNYEANIQFGQIVTKRGVMLFDERVIEDLQCMIQTAKEDGVVLEIQSPYRDYQYQRWLFNRKISIYMQQGLSYIEAYQISSQAVTVPNASEHQIGLALDILTDNYFNLNEGFANTAAGKWLAANSYKYGFILRYPKGKEDITCIEYEPWHFRYVGVEAATVITKSKITLEEFWEEYL